MALISDFIQADKITSDLVTQLVSRKAIFTQVADVKVNYKGSSAQIPVANSGTIGNYVPGTPMAINNVTSSSITIDLNQSKYINDYVDSVDKASSSQDVMRQVLNTLTTNMDTVIDTYAQKEWFDNAGIVGTSADIGVTGGPITVDEDNIDKYLTDVSRLMDENDVPSEDRIVILTPKLIQSLSLNNTYIAATTDEMSRRRGYKGLYADLEVMVSNSVPTGTAGGLEVGERGVVAAHKSALNVLFNYQDIKISTDALYRGEFISSVVNYGAGVNTPIYVVAGVVAE